MRSQPGSSCRMKPPTGTPTRSREVPYISYGMRHPTFATIYFIGRFGTCSCQRFYISEQRSITFGEITHVGSPVILLRIDIQVIIAGPGHIARQIIVPYPLQVSR